MLNPLTIMKNLTATKKSVYWTMQDGSKVVCRVATKGGGQKLVDLINEGVTDFVLEHLPVHRARYLAYKGDRLCRISIKAFNQLMKYLVGGVDALPNQLTTKLTKTTKKLINHDYFNSDYDQQPSNPITISSSDCSSTLRPSFWLEIDSQIDSGKSQSLLFSESLGNRDRFEQGISVSSIQRFDPTFQGGDEFLDHLEKLDQKLRADVERGNRFIKEGSELIADGSGLEKEVGDDYVGTGQLIVGVANLQRDQLEIALGQREIREGQREIREGQKAIREGQRRDAIEVNRFTRGVIEFTRGVIAIKELCGQQADLDQLDQLVDTAALESTIAKLELSVPKIEKIGLPLLPPAN